MTVLSGRRMVDPVMKHRLSLIVPHASRALLINRAMTSQLTLATALAEVLNNLACGIFLLDGSCRVVHANSGARFACGRRSGSVRCRAIGDQQCGGQSDAAGSVRDPQ